MDCITTFDETLINRNIVKTSLNSKNTINESGPSVSFSSIFSDKINQSDNQPEMLQEITDLSTFNQFESYGADLKKNDAYHYKMCVDNINAMSKIKMDVNKWTNTLTRMPWQGVQNSFNEITNKILNNPKQSDDYKTGILNGLTNKINSILDSDLSEFEKLRQILAVLWVAAKAQSLCSDEDAIESYYEGNKVK